MAETTVNTPAAAVERNIQLAGDVMRYLMDHPRILDSLPDKFELVILPEDDPEMRLYNLELLDRYGSEGKPVVLARLKARRDNAPAQIAPDLFVPLPVAA